MREVWTKPEPFIVGSHTREICEIIDGCIRRFRQGESSYHLVKCPPRHGKSDIISRNLPPHFLGEFPDCEVLLSSYSAGSANGFSRNGRTILKSKNYQKLYPQISLSKDVQNVAEWEVDHIERPVQGKAQFVGIGGSITGKGGDLIIIDDFLRSRKDAESKVMRQNIWDSFTNDIWTRRAPIAIVIILATAWHTDDLFGRIKKKMKEDPEFPHFYEHNFRAFDESYDKGILFPERFSQKYYNEIRSALGTYGSAALLQGEPVMRGGNLFKTDQIKYITDNDEWKALTKGLKFNRGWDLASSEKQQTKDDPDRTCGFKVAVRKINTPIKEISAKQFFVEDVIRGQWEAPKRDKIIVDAAIADGSEVNVGVEAFGGYKDAFTTLKKTLFGVRSVEKVNLPGDKLQKVGLMGLEQAFESGNVYMRKREWNEDVVEELSSFPLGAHDDDVDAFVVAAAMDDKKGPTFGLAKY